jgi:RNA polymerase sigma-70 factor (ECF subfamily)
MVQDNTTIIVQGYLDALAADTPPDAVVRSLLGRAVGRLEMLCGNLLQRGYPRLMQPPLNLRPDEVLSSVVERLLKALRDARPTNVRQFFALANQHIRWELNDVARRLDEQPAAGQLPAPPSSAPDLTPGARRILAAIDSLPEEEREAFSLVRIQGLSQAEAAEVIGISTKTVQRRLNSGLLLLAERLDDLRPELPPAGDTPREDGPPETDQPPR